VKVHGLVAELSDLARGVLALERRQVEHAEDELERLDERPGARLLSEGALLRGNGAIFVRSEHAARP